MCAEVKEFGNTDNWYYYDLTSHYSKKIVEMLISDRTWDRSQHHAIVFIFPFEQYLFAE